MRASRPSTSAELTYVTSTIAGPAIVAAKLSELTRVRGEPLLVWQQLGQQGVPPALPHAWSSDEPASSTTQQRRKQPGEPGERYGAEKHGAHHVVGEQQPPGRPPAQTAAEHQRADHARQRVRGHRAADP